MKEKIAFYPTPQLIVNKMIELGSYDKNDKILDSGFGEGVFIQTLYDLGYKSLIGVEYATDFFEKLNSKKLNLKLYHQNYLSIKEEGKIDHVIGNPPYINSDNLDSEVKNNVRDITKSGEGNIYYAFIIKSIQLLKEGGSLNYILPYDFFYNTYGQYLRKYMIENGYFTHIIDFGETKLFKNAAPETIIFKYVKDTKIKTKSKIKILKTKNKTNLENLQKDWQSQFISYEIDNFKDENIWHLSNVEEVKGTKLKDIKNVKISVGVVNGFEGGFLLPKELELKLKDSERKYIKKFTKNSLRDDKYKVKDYLKGDIKYIYIPNNEFSNEEELAQKLPNIYNHLIKFKEDMLKRKLAKNKMWFDYLAIRNVEVFEGNKNKIKIHVPSLSRRERDWFFKTNNENYIAGDLLTITCKENQEQLLKIYEYLNSEDFVKYYSQVGAKKGKRVVFTQKILSEIKIPKEYLIQKIK